MFLSIITRCKDEFFIKEFIDYYLCEGVDHIYIIDDDSNDKSIYNDVEGYSNVTIFFEKNIIQSNFASSVYKQIQELYEWIAYIDVDEFITSNKHKSLRLVDIIKTEFCAVDCIKIPWVMMSSNGAISNPKSILQANVWRWNHDTKHPHTVSKFRCRYEKIEVKCIFKTASFTNIFDHHPLNPRSSATIVNSVDKKPSKLDSFYEKLTEEKIKQAHLMCYHYRIISRQNNVSKLKNNKWYIENGYTLSDLESSDYPEIFDDSLRIRSVKSQPVIVCTGFHRSATSTLANYLANAGLDLGEDLVASHISNVKGHYEDLKAVKLHDEQLKVVGSNWQFHDEVALDPEPDFLYEYINARTAKSYSWGVKDPRICLFLEQWDDALGNLGNYVFIARHWSGCIESLLNRHSRELAYGLMDVTDENPHLKIWAQPDIAAKAWLAYNKRMLKFAKAHPDKVILCTQRALFEGAPLINSINARFGFELDASIDPPFDNSLFNDSASISVKDSLSLALQRQLDSVWEELLNIANFSSANELPVYSFSAEQDERYYLEYKDTVANLSVPVSAFSREQLKREVDISLLSTLDEKSCIDYLVDLRSQLIDEQSLSKVKLHFNEAVYTVGKVQLELARLLQVNKSFIDAIHVYHKCIALGINYPYVNMLLGECYQATEEYELALYYFDKAIAANPNNPTFYVKKAGCLIKLSKSELAENEFLIGIKLLGYLAPLALNYSEFLVQQGKIEDALEVLAQSEKTHPAVLSKIAQLKLARDYKSGVSTYYELMAQQVKGKNKFSWLNKISSNISCANAERDFVVRCFKHWAKL